MTHRILNYKNINLSYYEQGQGETIIFLHGFLATANMWDYYIAHFAHSYHTIAVDLLGHGETECLGYIHTMEDMADAVYNIIQEHQLDKVTLVGHSMGGYVALAFGELYPDHVQKIILVASSAQADSPERKINRDRSIQVVKKNSDAFIRMALTHMFTEEDRLTHHKELDNAITKAQQNPLQGVIAALEGMKERTDREVLLHFAPFPIAIILGRYDSVNPIQNALLQIEGTNIPSEVIEGGHMLHIDSKELLKNSLDKFIQNE